MVWRNTATEQAKNPNTSTADILTTSNLQTDSLLSEKKRQSHAEDIFTSKKADEEQNRKSNDKQDSPETRQT